MEIPGKVSLFCPLVDAKGTPATLITIDAAGYFHLEVVIKGNRHTMFVPIAQAALYFAEPEPQTTTDFEIER